MQTAPSPNKVGGSTLKYSTSRLSNNNYPSPNQPQRLPAKTNGGYVKNSAQKKQQVLENLRRANVMTSSETDDETSCDTAGFLVDKSIPFAYYSHARRENQSRSASLIRPEPIVI